MSRLPMLGRVTEADFEANTLTGEMSGECDYYAKASEYVLIPKAAWDWLMGLGETFEPSAESPPLVPGGTIYPKFWWRSELRRRIAADAVSEPYAAGGDDKK